MSSLAEQINEQINEQIKKPTVQDVYERLITRAHEQAKSHTGSLSETINAMISLRQAFAPDPTGVEQAVQAIKDAMVADVDFAFTWHANLAMAFVDAGCDVVAAQKGASIFLARAFEVSYGFEAEVASAGVSDEQ